ncbi:MAG TPA: hypothetical protein VJP08_02800 [Actinomycetota bacterium]|nr:hypothetical protein [Actinomycetota bacterium]
MSRPDRSITRNPLILAAGILMMLSGVFGVTSIVRALGAGFGAVEVLYLLVWLMLAAVSIFAGWWVLNQQERGRSLGQVLAIVGLVLALFSLLLGSGLLIVSLLINAFILFVLVTRAREFA